MDPIDPTPSPTPSPTPTPDPSPAPAPIPIPAPVRLSPTVVAFLDAVLAAVEPLVVRGLQRLTAQLDANRTHLATQGLALLVEGRALVDQAAGRAPTAPPDPTTAPPT